MFRTFRCRNFPAMEEELQKLTVVRLKEKLTEKGLDTKGVKAVLVKRLLEVLQNEAEKTGETSEDATESESPVLGGDISQLDGDDDTNGKHPMELSQFWFYISRIVTRIRGVGRKLPFQLLELMWFVYCTLDVRNLIYFGV